MRKLLSLCTAAVLVAAYLPLPALAEGALDKAQTEYAWVLVETKMNDWQEKLDAQNKYTEGIWRLEVSASEGGATFTQTYINQNPGDSWLKTGMAQSGQVTWTAPSHTVIKPDEEFSVNLTVAHLQNSHSNQSGGWSGTVQVFRIDENGDQKEAADELADKDGESGFQAYSYADNLLSPTVFGKIGSGSAEGERMNIRVIAFGGISVETCYIYEWKRADGSAPSSAESSAETPKPETQDPQAAPESSENQPKLPAWARTWEDNRSRVPIERRYEFWIRWAEQARQWTPEDIEEAKKAQGIVKIGDLHGETWILRGWEEDLDAAIYAELDTPLYHGDLIITRKSSGAILSFSDMSTFNIKENTSVVLDIKNERESKIALVAGIAWGNLKKMMEGRSMEIEMGQAVAGIKGTTFICEENDGVSTVKVFEGTVEVTSKATGKSVMVGGGEMLGTDSSGKGTLTVFDMEAELEGWDETARRITAEAMEEDAREKGGFPVVIVVAGTVLLAAGGAAAVFITARSRRKAAAAPAYAASARADGRQSAKLCPNCGNPLGENSNFCGKCGQRLP
ncbi:MAG TPA: FecR domain-containing protein [Oscillospiraceae bacterium]|nr:FecR domain-containing protein [Oscillospiraceae bacterium]HNW03848.1 FecR domain-containing protein [Oscillospiraceae bacterium]HPV99828.1 FecR domain-containing protein [Oscillospiraceae bacterium]